jgi:hypothetical protein
VIIRNDVAVNSLWTAGARLVAGLAIMPASASLTHRSMTTGGRPFKLAVVTTTELASIGICFFSTSEALVRKIEETSKQLAELLFQQSVGSDPR